MVTVVMMDDITLANLNCGRVNLTDCELVSRREDTRYIECKLTLITYNMKKSHNPATADAEEL
jgi:hypothetical protein